MPDLDVTDILLDPDFCQQLTINRITQDTTAGGIVTNTTATFNPYGVVTIGPLKDIVRTDAYEAGNNVITVHSYDFRLREMAPGFQPDVVVWQGDSYVVKKSLNWSQYGVGFTAAECELQQTVTTT